MSLLDHYCYFPKNLLLCYMFIIIANIRIPNLGCKNQDLGSIIINSGKCYVLFKEMNRGVKGNEKSRPIS